MVMSIISLEVTGCKWAICPEARWSKPRGLCSNCAYISFDS